MRSWITRVTAFLRTRRMRRIGVTLAVILLLYTIGGFFGVPALLRHILTTNVASAIKRPVTVGDIAFNPFRLRLELDKLHIADTDPSKPFVDLGHLRVKVSWTSLFRKPFRFALSNIELRGGDVRFDDQVLGEKHSIEHMELDLPFIANLPADTDIYVQPLLRMDVDGSPFKIAGRALPFTKQPESEVVLSINHFNLVPYVGYVPAKLPIKIPSGALSALLKLHFVQAEEGPAIRISGETSLDDFEVHDAADAPLAGFKTAAAKLDDVEPLHGVFHLGAITLDGLNVALVRNRDGTTNLTPLMAPQAAIPAATSGTQSASSVNSVALTPSPAVSPIASSSPAPRAPPVASPIASPAATASPTASSSPVAVASPATTISPTPGAISVPSIASSATNPAPIATPTPSTEKPPLDLTIESVKLTNSGVKLTDNSLATPATVALQNINIGLKQFALGAKASPSAYEFAGVLSGGGSIGVKGNLDLVQAQVTSDVTIDQVDLPALQAYAQPALTATFSAGKLNAHANLLTSFAAGKFNLHVEPATFSVDQLELRPATGGDKPIQWTQVGATITQVDLASHQAVVKEAHADGIRLSVKRERDGKLSLLSLLRTQSGSTPESPAPVRQPKSSRRTRQARPTQQAKVTVTRGKRSPTRRPRGGASPATPAIATTPAGPVWQYQVETIAINKAEINAEDDMAPRPVKATIAPFNVVVRNFTQDLKKPFNLETDGTLNRRGTFKIEGPVVIDPLKATLRVTTRKLDLAFADPYATKDLNATLKSWNLTVSGVASAANVRDKLRISYRGDATIGNVRLLDKLTGDDFVRWNSVSFSRIDFGLGEGLPMVHIGAIALTDFYARLILNANGRMNLSDITSNPSQAPKSLTREQNGQAAAPIPPATPSATPTASPVPAPATSPTPATTTSAPPTTAGGTSGSATTIPAPAPKPIAADIELGRITLQGGHVDYSDFFIKPNYRANLTNISGKVGAFGTSSTTPADVLVEGQINGNAPINISGTVNPLAPLAAI
ncbi:MAG: DUF748 domain-containing protein, partial [Deltaproteobacteria bacterium]|nr:DUF748 domain-containing protein [Deltaproteobacteria bacterium]